MKLSKVKVGVVSIVLAVAMVTGGAFVGHSRPVDANKSLQSGGGLTATVDSPVLDGLGNGAAQDEPQDVTAPSQAQVGGSEPLAQLEGEGPGTPPAEEPNEPESEPVTLAAQHDVWRQDARSADALEHVCVSTWTDGSVTEVPLGGRSKANPGMSWQLDNDGCPVVE